MRSALGQFGWFGSTWFAPLLADVAQGPPKAALSALEGLLVFCGLDVGSWGRGGGWFQSFMGLMVAVLC